MDDRLKRMKELAAVLSEASRAYYQESRELMSNLEYDRLYDELLRLEEETGTVFAGSPTQKVGYEVLSELPRERHEKPMLSLNKTKSVDELKEWLGNQTGLLSWKMDGLTVVLTYENGVLSKAVTRGNGEIGEVITGNARTFVNLPMSIPYKERLILRGEAVITYSDFEKLNASIADADARYKNPRNLCSGSVRQLNSAVTASRNVRFMAFSLVQADGVDFKNSRKEQFLWLASMGFETVEFVEVTPETGSRTATSPPTAWCFSMTISPTAHPWAAPPNSPEILLPLSGRTSSRRPLSPILNGAHPGRDLSIRWPYSSRWSWRGPP